MERENKIEIPKNVGGKKLNQQKEIKKKISKQERTKERKIRKKRKRSN